MKESFWGIFVIFLGVTALVFIVLFQNLTNTDQHNYSLLNEVTEAAMNDAIDYSAFRQDGTLKINREKFVESFLRRYAQSASRSREYDIIFYDINETPPMVSVGVKSGVVGVGGNQQMTFDLNHRVNAILESPLLKKGVETTEVIDDSDDAEISNNSSDDNFTEEFPEDAEGTIEDVTDNSTESGNNPEDGCLDC